MSMTESENSKTTLNAYIEALSELDKYREIGTVSEFRELKEMEKAKKPIKDGWFEACPCCGETGVEIFNYCPSCGQKLDWSEGKE